MVFMHLLRNVCVILASGSVSGFVKILNMILESELVKVSGEVKCVDNRDL